MQVESRENAKGNFGLGYKRTMTFSKFLRRLAEGDTSLYLTTQEVCSKYYAWQTMPSQQSDNRMCDHLFCTSPED